MVTGPRPATGTPAAEPRAVPPPQAPAAARPAHGLPGAADAAPPPPPVSAGGGAPPRSPARDRRGPSGGSAAAGSPPPEPDGGERRPAAPDLPSAVGAPTAEPGPYRGRPPSAHPGDGHRGTAEDPPPAPEPEARRSAPGTPAQGTGDLAEVERIAAAVPDPEMPMLTLEDLGILRAVRRGGDGRPVVEITPTYSGCPAMDAIRDDVRGRLAAHGHGDAEVRTVLSPPWSTDLITEEGRRKLAEHGIAPPTGRAPAAGAVVVPLSVRCPRCGSMRTRELSRFGSTACKALRVCDACREPFDHVKPF